MLIVDLFVTFPDFRSRDAEDAYFDCESEEECEATEQMEDDREFNPPPLRPRKTSSSEDKS